ncbi:prolyl oligopeptidase family serine peptidase [Sorangium sp. So ce1389]|uniref:prolyl oligopeptidase family serine peptidase n=1 Tax=Sorangium sp. So ce1389 TaxID=3133336 RepID=UPI003F600519
MPRPRPGLRARRTSPPAPPGPRRGRALLAGATLAGAAAWIAAACSTPSSGVDGGDLLGVFERDAGAGAAAADGGQPRTATGRQDAGARAAGSPSAAAAQPAKPPEARPPSEGSCVAEQGRPGRELRKTLGRPPCRGAQVLEARDAEGSPRYACVIAPSGVETRAPLPLIVFFHADGDDPTSVDKETGLRKLGATWNLTGDPAHAGFIVLAPQGRAFKSPTQAERERGTKTYTAVAPFDAEFTGDGNVDVATVDAFVDQLLQQKLVDRRRIYALGASYGGHMAATYAMMRADRVAAFATFGSDAPPASWACPGPPPPAMAMYRACDDVFPCESVERWLRARDATSAHTSFLRLDEANRDEPHCALRNRCSAKKGAINHARWPKSREADLLRFFAGHTLAVGGDAASTTAETGERTPNPR